MTTSSDESKTKEKIEALRAAANAIPKSEKLDETAKLNRMMAEAQSESYDKSKPNNDLERLFVECTGSTDLTKASELMTTLMDSTVAFALDISGEQPQPVGYDSNPERIFPCFTGLNRVGEWISGNHHEQYLQKLPHGCMDARTFFRGHQNGSVVVLTGDLGLGKQFSSQEIKQLLDGTHPLLPKEKDP
jgi:hypothetical protein